MGRSVREGEPLADQAGAKQAASRRGHSGWNVTKERGIKHHQVLRGRKGKGERGKRKAHENGKVSG